jgi:hypothetical protein
MTTIDSIDTGQQHSILDLPSKDLGRALANHKPDECSQMPSFQSDDTANLPIPRGDEVHGDEPTEPPRRVPLFRWVSVPGFSCGTAAIFDPADSLMINAEFDSAELADAEAIYADWMAVGEDMIEAVAGLRSDREKEAR